MINEDEKQGSTQNQKWIKSYSASLNKLSKLNLNLTELRIILYLASILNDRNYLISLSQYQISDDLKIKQPNISIAFKSLKEKGILMQKGRKSHLMLNSEIFQFGNNLNPDAVNLNWGSTTIKQVKKPVKKSLVAAEMKKELVDIFT